MKHTFRNAAASAAMLIAFAACNENSIVEQAGPNVPSTRKLTFSANLSGATQNRASIDYGNASSAGVEAMHWDEGDQLSLWIGTTKKVELTLREGAGTNRGMFESNVPVDVPDGSYEITGYYPASIAPAIVGGEPNLSVVSSGTFTQIGTDPKTVLRDAMLMKATGSGTLTSGNLSGISFKQLTGLIHLKIGKAFTGGLLPTRVVLHNENGKFYNGLKTISLAINNAEFGADNTFHAYIPVLPTATFKDDVINITVSCGTVERPVALLGQNIQNESNAFREGKRYYFNLTSVPSTVVAEVLPWGLTEDIGGGTVTPKE